jgi:Mg-chelatase subunit ChlD
MGFLDYAQALSLQKDHLKTKIRVNSQLQQPILEKERAGFNVFLPIPLMSEEGTTSFLGYVFPQEKGKILAGRLFRACVSHLTAHTLPLADDALVDTHEKSHRDPVETFATTLVNDVYVNTYLSATHADRLADLAYANSLAFAKIKSAEKIFNPATRIMAALLSEINVGMTKGVLPPQEESATNELAAKLAQLREEIGTYLAGKRLLPIESILEETATDVIQSLESHGPILEAPSFPHTERIGPCTIFSKCNVLPSEGKMRSIFYKSLGTLGGAPPEDSAERCWKKETDVEAVQAFDSWIHQKAREQKMLTRMEEHLAGTRLKSVSFPDEDYTQYLRTRILLRGGSRRLLDSLRVARDALDEDPRKEQGQLDLTEVIQKLASRSPRTDVFMENEYLSKSFAWSLLFDASASMKIRGEISRALAICVAEATNELLMDPNSWSFLAFSDRLYILKDPSEPYSRRVRARIGGLKFKGLTYMPDAMQVAGEILKQRFDEQRFLIVLSDGWPFGYPDIPAELSEAIASLEKRGMIVVGVGLESERMDEFFKTSCAIYNQRDLIKKFGNLYVGASVAAREA